MNFMGLNNTRVLGVGAKDKAKFKGLHRRLCRSLEDEFLAFGGRVIGLSLHPVVPAHPALRSYSIPFTGCQYLNHSSVPPPFQSAPTPERCSSLIRTPSDRLSCTRNESFDQCDRPDSVTRQESIAQDHWFAKINWYQIVTHFSHELVQMIYTNGNFFRYIYSSTPLFWAAINPKEFFWDYLQPIRLSQIPQSFKTIRSSYGELPANLYRVQYPGCQTALSGNGLQAKETNVTYSKDDMNPFRQSIIDQLTWGHRRAQPYIICFSEKDHVKNWVCKELWNHNEYGNES